MSDKEHQFITEVQTALIINSVRKDQSATQSLGVMDDAYYASKRIPEQLTAHEAACEFLDHVISEDRSLVRAWFTRT